jgi:hypothetical protein
MLAGDIVTGILEYLLKKVLQDRFKFFRGNITRTKVNQYRLYSNYLLGVPAEPEISLEGLSSKYFGVRLGWVGLGWASMFLNFSVQRELVYPTWQLRWLNSSLHGKTYKGLSTGANSMKFFVEI